MATTKITLNELRSIVKQIIKEANNKYQDLNFNFAIPYDDRLEFNVNEVNNIKELLKKKGYTMGSYSNLIAYPEDKTLLFFTDDKTSEFVSSNNIRITKTQEQNEYLPTYIVHNVGYKKKNKIKNAYKVNGLAKLGFLLDDILR